MLQNPNIFKSPAFEVSQLFWIANNTDSARE